MTVKTIDVTPTWAEIVPILIELLAHKDARKTAIDELYKMALCADAYVTHLKQTSEKLEELSK